MTIATISFAYIAIVLSIIRFVHVLRVQESKMRESQIDGTKSVAPDLTGNSKAAA